MKSVTLHDIALYQRTSQCYVSCYGCHLRLHRRWRTHSQYLPDSRIAVAGAGSDPTDHPKVNNVFDAIFFIKSLGEGLVVDHSTIPQKILNSSYIMKPAGHLLSRSSGVNAGN